MKIPIFEEVLLKGTGHDDILDVVLDSRIGKVPCYINLSNYSSDDFDLTILNLEQVFLEQSIHPCFPYPVYIIYPKSSRTIIPVVRTVKDLPEHYFKKVKRPNNKELQLLNKLSLKVDKIKFLELYKISQDLKETSISQKDLYRETKELYFLEVLNAKLFEKNKTKNPKSRN
jgi:hypothetical protein